jgi:hypothetical protein
VTPQVAQQWFGVAKDAVGTANEEAMGGVSLVVTDGAALEKSKTSKKSKKSKSNKESRQSRQSKEKSRQSKSSRGGAGRRKGRADAEDDGEEGAEKETEEGEGEGEGEEEGTQHAILAMSTDNFESDSIRRFLTTEITARAPRKSARAQESCNQADAASEYE